MLRLFLQDSLHNRITASNGNSTLEGSSGDDELLGSSGNDILIAGQGGGQKVARVPTT
ncbi:MAG: hypothetical protein ACKO7W_21285 [Elainella sp.]